MGSMILAPLARPANATPIGGGDGTHLSAESPGWIEAEDTRAFIYPPQHSPASARPVTVVLHGLCGEPRSACGPFVDPSTARGWLVCPRAEDPCGGGSRWRLRPEDDAQRVETSIGELARERPGMVDVSSPRILVGFSLGGIAAVRIAQSTQPDPDRNRRYAGLVVIASQVHPDAELLKKAGVARVVLAAGDLDITSRPLQEDARAMNRSGLPTRFVSLGNFGHGYPSDMRERMREPMAWVAGAGADGDS
jgi:predicted esterase